MSPLKKKEKKDTLGGSEKSLKMLKAEKWVGSSILGT